MKPMTPGRFLSSDQSVRLIVGDGAERRALIKHAVEQIRYQQRAKVARLRSFPKLEAR